MMFLLFISSLIAYCASNSEAAEFHSSALVSPYDEDKSTTPKTNPSKAASGKFICPSWYGRYPHPDDCSKYYSCQFMAASVKTCPPGQLFEAVRRTCETASSVNCGDRPRPGVSTTVDKLTSFSPSTIVDDISVSTDDQPPTITDSPTTTEEDRKRPTGPPDTDCLEGDDECLIKEMGDPNDWFKCPAAFGSHPHPSSKRLFIFCKNWLPSVKKCGMKRVYSKEMSTCV